MTVKELIKELRKHDPNKEVLIEPVANDDYDYYYAIGVTAQAVINYNPKEDEEVTMDCILITSGLP